jgi:ATP-dependent RNA helicase RhlB
MPHTLTGRDAFGQAQTGTGKTAAFMLATLDFFLRNPAPPGRRVGRPRALVIAPTRELVMQIYNDAMDLSKYTGFECAVLFGGMDYEKQQRQLQNKVIDVVCATPGRLLDFKRRGDLDLSGVEILILDEADRMLDMGFIPDVREIVHSTPPKNKRQTMLFSATFPEEIKRLATQWTKDPVTITIHPESVAVDTVEQIVYIVTLNQRFGLIHYILSQPNMERAIIFVNRRYEAEKLADMLHRYGFNCDLLSGAVPQNKRMKTLEMFKEGKIQVLVATDVAGRGLHVEGVSHVINFSLPDDPEDYVHRIGRTGRAGASGISISFATEDDAYNIPEIEKFIGRPLPCTHPEESWLVLPEPPAGTHAPRHKSTTLPPRPGGRGGPRPGGRGGPRGGGRPPRRP